MREGVEEELVMASKTRERERERERRKIRSGLAYFHIWRENMMIGQKKTGKLKVDWWIETRLY